MCMKTNHNQQYDVLLSMQSAGFNVCTCGNCGGVILYDQEMRDAEVVECPHCKEEMDYSDNPDLYWEHCTYLYEEDNLNIET